MQLRCPSCNSTQIETLDRAQKAGGAVGFIGGAASGAAGAMGGARLGASVGLAGGPVGAAIGGIAGAILGGLMGGTAGGITGSQLGKVVDAHYLKNYSCQSCGFAFDATEAKRSKRQFDPA